MNIRNIDDLRCAYFLLRMYTENGKEYSPKACELKRKIRRFTKISNEKKIIKDNGFDGYIELVEVPNCLDNLSKENVKEWFEHECCIEPAYSAYDCTGQAFTSWYKVFQRRSHWFVYHSVAFDV